MSTRTTPTARSVEPHSGLYAAGMVKRVLVGIQAFRDGIRDRIAAVEGGEHAVVARRGRPVVVVVPIDWYREAAQKMKDPTDF